MVWTLTLRTEHQVALRGGTRGLLSLQVDCRAGVGRDEDRGDPAGTGTLRTFDQPLPVRELLALLPEQHVADLGRRDQDGGGVVPVPLGAGRGPVDDVGHGSPRRDSTIEEVLFAEILPFSLHAGYVGQPPLVVRAFDLLQGGPPGGRNLARKNVTTSDERETGEKRSYLNNSAEVPPTEVTEESLEGNTGEVTDEVDHFLTFSGGILGDNSDFWFRAAVLAGCFSQPVRARLLLVAR